MQARVIFLADFDYFFAQCEELRNPAIKDKPVVVGVYSGPHRRKRSSLHQQLYRPQIRRQIGVAAVFGEEEAGRLRPSFLPCRP